VIITSLVVFVLGNQFSLNNEIEHHMNSYPDVQEKVKIKDEEFIFEGQGMDNKNIYLLPFSLQFCIEYKQFVYIRIFHDNSKVVTYVFYGKALRS